jgi:hypothetical protein
MEIFGDPQAADRTLKLPTAGQSGSVKALLPHVSLQHDLPADPATPLKPFNLTLSAHHYFLDQTTPVFDFDAPESPDLGMVLAQKRNSSEAPLALVSRADAGNSNDVAWVYLVSRPETVGPIKAVYRVETAGGNPPEDCRGQSTSFSIQYSALYWFYN